MILSHADEETIIARCTPQGSGAIALIRLSGKNAIEIATKISVLPSKKTLSQMATHTIHYGFVVDEQGKHIDQVLFLLMRAPNTFTGQDTVEITCHNNSFLIEQIIQQAIKHDARPAMEGEFTKRAVLTGKIDLIQAEAINDLIHANTQVALKQSLAQLEGTFSHYLQAVEKSLLKALAFCEASFEFIDEEIEFGSQIAALIAQTLTTIETLKKSYAQQQQIRQGIRIAILGSVNAGKSSLFNSLLNKERSIVTPIAGTTRDTIESGLYIHGNYWTLVDTAGLRTTQDIVEQAGIKRSFEQADLADIIILVFDGSRSLLKEEVEVYQRIISMHHKKIIFVTTKADLMQEAIPLLMDKQIIQISNTLKTNVNLVAKTIQEKINELFKAFESPFLLNQRQYNLLLALEKKIADLPVMCNGAIAYELLSIHLNDALTTIAELTGKSISEAAMDAIFREFCVGK